MAKIVTANEAAKLIQDESIICTGGFIGSGVAEEVHIAVENRFLSEGKPNNITLFYAAGQGDGKSRGLNHYAHEGLLKRIIGGHWGLVPKFQPLVVGNKVEGYNIPQGCVTHMIRAAAGRKPFIATHVGLGTFFDPEFGGGKLNDISKEELVSKMNYDGKDYLLYKSIFPNVAIVKGTFADENGNITMEKEPLTLEGISIATATKNNGGIVIVQVEGIVKNGTIDPKNVIIPGILVDYIVVVEDMKNHMQTFGTQYNEAFIRSDIKVDNQKSVYPLNERKVIGRRSAMLLNKNARVLNYGIGVPEVIAQVLSEEGQEDHFIPTVEPGIIGGTPAGGLDFGASTCPQAIYDQPYQFDFYDGGGLDFAFLGLAQCDTEGNINVSKFGPKIAGAGGFVNITQNAKEVCFCGTFTAGGLEVEVKDGKLNIITEGRTKKFIKEVEQITFSGNVARFNGKNVFYVTERAVFELRKDGLTLTEIAPGVELQKDILDQMDFKPLIAEDLKEMDACIFEDKPMGLKF
jgi:propionate CoA-transferase